MYIRMDSREPKKLYEILTERHSLTVKYERLDVGDYVFSDLVIERKTVGDFLKSLRDGRIWDQLSRCKENYPRVIILLEGSLPYSYNKATAVDEMKAIGGMLGIAMGWNVPIVPSNNIDQTAKIIDSAFRRADKTKTEYLRPTKKKHYKPEEVREDILCTIPGIGRKTARAILKKFPSIAGVMTATDEELKSVPRIGKKTVEWIRTVFNHNEDSI